MPKLMCKKCGRLTYLSELDKDGYCGLCSMDFEDDEEQKEVKTKC